MIFDIKMDGNFNSKSRFVASGHTTYLIASIIYSSVVSKDSVRIIFMLTALHELDVCATNIGNAYLNTPCREKILTKTGPGFGIQKGYVMLVVRALYGLKSRGASWREILEETLGKNVLGYTSTAADRDAWIKR